MIMLLDIIPDILQYFISGFIFVFIYKILCSKKIELSMQLIMSCVISFAWVSLINAINEIWLHNCHLSSLWVVVSISIILSAIASILFSKLVTSNWFHKKTVKYFGISPHNSVWRNITKSGSSNVKVYLRDKDY